MGIDKLSHCIAMVLDAALFGIGASASLYYCFIREQEDRKGKFATGLLIYLVIYTLLTTCVTLKELF